MKLDIQLFADGTISGTSTASNGDIRIVWSSTSNDSTNSSSVTAKVQVRRKSGSGTTGTFSGSLTINGVEKSVSKKLTNLGTSWKDVGTNTIDVAHNNDGTKSITISSRLTQSGTSLAGTYTASGTAVLDTISRAGELTYITGSIISGSFWPEFNTYGLYQDLLVYYVDSNNTKYLIKTITDVVNNGRYSFTTSERETIYGYTPNSKHASMTFVLATYADASRTIPVYNDASTSTWSSISKNFDVGGYPTFSNFDYDDVNSTTLALTGSSKTIIKGYSNVKYKIVDADKAVAIAGASIASYSFKNSNGVMEVESNISYPLEKTYNNYNQNDLVVIARDSRTYERTVTKTPTLLITDYFEPYGTINAERSDGVGEQVKLDADISYYSGDFGGTGNNTINAVYYRTKTSNGSFGSWVDITSSATISNGRMTINDLRIYHNGSNFTIGVKYVVELKVIDGKSGTNFNTTTGIIDEIPDGTVLDSYYKDSNGDYKYAINKMVDKNGSTLQVNGDVSTTDKYYLSNSESIGSKKRETFSGISTTTGSWQSCTTSKSFNLKKGLYLVKMSITLPALGDGQSTINGAMDGIRQGTDWRQTIPLANGLNSTANIIVHIEVTSDGSHTFSCYTYNNANCDTASGYIDIIRLD